MSFPPAQVPTAAEDGAPGPSVPSFVSVEKPWTELLSFEGICTYYYTKRKARGTVVNLFAAPVFEMCFWMSISPKRRAFIKVQLFKCHYCCWKYTRVVPVCEPKCWQRVIFTSFHVMDVFRFFLLSPAFFPLIAERTFSSVPQLNRVELTKF